MTVLIVLPILAGIFAIATVVALWIFTAPKFSVEPKVAATRRTYPVSKQDVGYVPVMDAGSPAADCSSGADGGACH